MFAVPRRLRFLPVVCRIKNHRMDFNQTCWEDGETGQTKNPLKTGAELDDGKDPGFIFCCEQMLVLV